MTKTSDAPPGSVPADAVASSAMDSTERRLLERVRPPAWINPTPQPSYDLVILGGGRAGLAAARTARHLGLTVALVERNRLGGVSLHTGSVPSKSLIRTGRAFEAVIHSERFGAPSVDEPAADMLAVGRRLRRIRTRIAEYDSVERLRTAGIEVFFGAAAFVGEHSVRVDSLELRFEKALIATGARPTTCDVAGLAETGYLTSDTAFDLTHLPKRLGIIGGGPLGCEMAQAFAHLGARVTLLQSEPKFLPREERDAAEILSLSLSRSGVDTRLNTTVVGAREQHGEKWIEAENTGTTYSLAVDEILVSIGRTPNTHGLHLDAANIAHASDGSVEVDDFLRTSNASVYAAGDVCMEHKFANIAEATGQMAVENAFGAGGHRRSRMIVPWCTYCDPEIAHVGMHIWEARRQCIEVKSFTVLMQDVDRAILDGRDDGFVKIHLREGSDEIIGATIVASRASEMINEISVIMHAKIGMRQLAGMLHTYPAQSNAIRLAALAYVKSVETQALNPA